VKAVIRGSILQPIIKLPASPLPEWKVRALAIGDRRSQRAIATKRIPRPFNGAEARRGVAV